MATGTVKWVLLQRFETLCANFGESEAGVDGLWPSEVLHSVKVRSWPACCPSIVNVEHAHTPALIASPPDGAPA
jgi:hypothetical protein